VIALDANILVYAHREDSDWHVAAKKAIAGLVEHGIAWCIPWPCVHEFIGITTHPRIFVPPSTPSQAFQQLEIWLEAPYVTAIGESELHLRQLKSLVVESRIQGPAVHDARIAAICLQHGVAELWTADRDFSRFPKLKTRNPLIGN
jgi:uncharacterized protein